MSFDGFKKWGKRAGVILGVTAAGVGAYKTKQWHDEGPTAKRANIEGPSTPGVKNVPSGVAKEKPAQPDSVAILKVIHEQLKHAREKRAELLEKQARAEEPRERTFIDERLGDVDVIIRRLEKREDDWHRALMPGRAPEAVVPAEKREEVPAPRVEKEAPPRPREEPKAAEPDEDAGEREVIPPRPERARRPTRTRERGEAHVPPREDRGSREGVDRRKAGDEVIVVLPKQKGEVEMPPEIKELTGKIQADLVKRHRAARMRHNEGRSETDPEWRSFVGELGEMKTLETWKVRSGEGIQRTRTTLVYSAEQFPELFRNVGGKGITKAEIRAFLNYHPKHSSENNEPIVVSWYEFRFKDTAGRNVGPVFYRWLRPQDGFKEE